MHDEPNTETETLLAALQAMGPALQEAAARIAPTARHEKPSPEAFSLNEHLCHLRDLEAEGYQQRIRRIVEEDLPTLEEIDGSAWAVEREYQQQDAHAALQAFCVHRERTVAMLREALPKHAQRKALFGGFGIVTLAGLAREIAAYDRVHLAEIAALPR